jgi:hypothetical protein
MPDWLVRFAACFDKSAAEFVPHLGEHFRVDNKKVRLIPEACP